MKLVDVAISSWVFSHVADYNDSHDDLVRQAGGAVDLFDKCHRQWVIEWLNKWGCRQFAVKYHALASENILQWFKKYSDMMPVRDLRLESLSDEAIDDISVAYAALVLETASKRAGCGRVKVGPTGAAKILFALRPLAVPPWDEPIRKYWKWDGSKRSYVEFLKVTRQFASELATDAQRLGFTLTEVPARVNRPDATIPKLIDEYLWVTITRQVELPSLDQLRAWLSLA